MSQQLLPLHAPRKDRHFEIVTDAAAYHPGLTYYDRSIWPWVLRELYECSVDGTRFSTTAFARRHGLTRQYIYKAMARYEAAGLLEVLRDPRGWIVDVQRTRLAISKYGERVAAEARGVAPWESRKPRSKGPPKTPVKAPTPVGALTGVLPFEPKPSTLVKAPTPVGALQDKAPTPIGAFEGSHPISLQTFEEDNVTLRGQGPGEEEETPENEPPPRPTAPPPPRAPIDPPKPPPPIVRAEAPPPTPGQPDPIAPVAEPDDLTAMSPEQLEAESRKPGMRGIMARFEKVRRKAATAEAAAAAAVPAPASEVKVPAPPPVVAPTAKPAAFIPQSAEDHVRRLMRINPDPAAAVEEAARFFAVDLDDGHSLGFHLGVCGDIQSGRIPGKIAIGAYRSAKRGGARNPAAVYANAMAGFREVERNRPDPGPCLSGKPGSGRSNPVPPPPRPGASP